MSRPVCGSAEPRQFAPLEFHGRVDLWTVESALLAQNPLGDPHVRELPVYVPPGLAPGGEADLPVLFVLAGFTSRGAAYLETHPWRRGFVWQYDRAVHEGREAPALLALPDCFTRLGGSQYVNSSAVGPYADHVLRELVPLVDQRYGTNRERRGVLGKSSGGFGALHLVMQGAGVFSAAGSISGDCGFDFLFPGEFLSCLRGLTPWDGDPASFLDDFSAKPDLSGDGHAVINTLAMAACYSPNPENALGFDLPFDLKTGEPIQSVWERWLAFDPLRAVERHADALRKLRLLHVECGLNDEFHLQWSLRRLHARLAALGIEHVHEEHPGGHRHIDHRFPPLIGRMARALA